MNPSFFSSVFFFFRKSFFGLLSFGFEPRCVSDILSLFFCLIILLFSFPLLLFYYMYRLKVNILLFIYAYLCWILLVVRRTAGAAAAAVEIAHYMSVVRRHLKLLPPLRVLILGIGTSSRSKNPGMPFVSLFILRVRTLFSPILVLPLPWWPEFKPRHALDPPCFFVAIFLFAWRMSTQLNEMPSMRVYLAQIALRLYLLSLGCYTRRV